MVCRSVEELVDLLAEARVVCLAVQTGERWVVQLVVTTACQLVDQSAEM
jgi:hypothetical protein